MNNVSPGLVSPIGEYWGYAIWANGQQLVSGMLYDTAAEAKQAMRDMVSFLNQFHSYKAA